MGDWGSRRRGDCSLECWSSWWATSCPPYGLRQPENENRLVLRQKQFFCWIDWLSGCLIHQIRLMLLPSPLRPAERSILFSGKSVRLSDDVRSTASSHAPKKGCSLREVWRSQTCTSGSPFFCLLFFGEAKKSKCPVGMRRMVKATPKLTTKHKPHFQAALWCSQIYSRSN